MKIILKKKITDTDWLNYKLDRVGKILIEQKKHSDSGNFKETWEYDKEDDLYCSKFGCGKKLTIKEKLAGSRCHHHQKDTNIYSVIDKYISK